MSVPLFEHTSLSIDVAISLGKRSGLPEAVIDRQLVDLLLAIEETASVGKSCEHLHISVRSAQRLLKRFSDGSGLRLTERRGCRGTAITDEGVRCIALYAATLSCVSQLVATRPPSQPPRSSENLPQSADEDSKDA